MADSIPVSLIDAERKAGWPTIHPEDYCHRCGGKNLTWFIDSEVWNSVMINATARWNGIVCPQCFSELFQESYPLTAFELVLDDNTKGAKAFRADRLRIRKQASADSEATHE